MQTTNFRYFVLIAVLLGGAGLYAAAGQPVGVGAPRWPAADATYAVQPWSAGPEAVEENTNHAGVVVTHVVTRVFRSPAGGSATFVVLSNQAPKLYSAGAEVPFLGSGYTVEPAPAELQPVIGDGVDALVAHRGPEQWLVMYAYGERRGMLGNGPLPWTLALFDGILGRPNDYYKMYLAARTDQVDMQRSRDVAALAHTLFPRIAAWYAA